MVKEVRVRPIFGRYRTNCVNCDWLRERMVDTPKLVQTAHLGATPPVCAI